MKDSLKWDKHTNDRNNGYGKKKKSEEQRNATSIHACKAVNV